MGNVVTGAECKSKFKKDQQKIKESKNERGTDGNVEQTEASAEGRSFIGQLISGHQLQSTS